MDKLIKITIRDINGKRVTWECDNDEIAYKFSVLACSELNDDEYEILLVTKGNVCLYSALSASHEITFEDLVGFFA